MRFKLFALLLSVFSVVVLFNQNCERQSSGSVTSEASRNAVAQESGHGGIYTGGFSYVLSDIHDLCDSDQVFGKINRTGDFFFLVKDKCKDIEPVLVEAMMAADEKVEFRDRVYVLESEVTPFEPEYLSSCEQVFSFAPGLPFADYYLNQGNGPEKVSCEPEIDDPIPELSLVLKSKWTSQCSSAPRSTGYASQGSPATSLGLVTSEWDGQPWSCLTARLEVRHPTAEFNLEMKSEWRSGCLAGGVVDAVSASANPKWSRPIVTSEWNGQPWSCLSYRLRQKKTAHTCRLELENYWGTCSTHPILASGGAWSAPIITSEWNGAPWNCLKARVYCE